VRQLKTGDLPLPHMGWNQIDPTDDPLFKGIAAGTHFYFVHSFAMPVNDFTIARAEYGEAFSAAVRRDNFRGVQFHPERSGAAGAKLLENFLECGL
jgi:glutamine amidotransferase